MPTEVQLRAFILAQEAANKLLSSWADYADASKTQVVPASAVRAAIAVSETNLNLIRPEN